jgi:SnoaL-like domain
LRHLPLRACQLDHPASQPHALPPTMNIPTREIVELHWSCANRRDWSGFEQLLAPALQYEVPQTREYISSGAGYLDMFRTWPGEWTATVKTLVCEGKKAVCIIDFTVGAEVMVGISVFEVSAGKITAVTDYWPEPYEPPARQSSCMKRRAQ